MNRAVRDFLLDVDFDSIENLIPGAEVTPYDDRGTQIIVDFPDGSAYLVSNTVYGRTVEPYDDCTNPDLDDE